MPIKIEGIKLNARRARHDFHSLRLLYKYGWPRKIKLMNHVFMFDHWRSQPDRVNETRIKCNLCQTDKRHNAIALYARWFNSGMNYEWIDLCKKCAMEYSKCQ